jgi:hypothetical protein
MLLYELAYASRIYAATFDAALKRFWSAVDPMLDLERPDHRTALLEWLNKWGCRQFAKKHHGRASQELIDWWRQQPVTALPRREMSWTDLSGQYIDLIEDAYRMLSARTASVRSRKSVDYEVRFGPAGAAKILYVLWPNAVPPWDDAIRQELGLDGSPDSYRTFLTEIVPSQIESLRLDAARFEIPLRSIPALLGRSESSLPKMVDEYFWVTITQRYRPPSKARMQEWAKWAS